MNDDKKKNVSRWGLAILSTFFGLLVAVLAVYFVILVWPLVEDISIGGRFILGFFYVLIVFGFAFLFIIYGIGTFCEAIGIGRSFAKYDDDVIQSHIQFGLISQMGDLYFTDAFLKSDEGIIDYQQIALMKTYYKDGIERTYFLTLYMLDGSTYNVGYGRGNDELNIIMTTLLQKNPEIRAEWSQYEWTKYLQNAKLYKKRKLKMPTMHLERLYALDGNQQIPGYRPNSLA